ncbi:probable arginine--tRNA ligase, mitochondrial isoform X1 [Carassius carassius]|uniref:probable arginine--tRNA ligase, mitochondrial isoform X1 n=1 Tax=Carassius carassius TaxID=217509 RepID=UPI0028697FD8|nr:probable arginine--tRNA ligase, mitochondrial isoform X1 [Carassius carassius]
MACFFRRRVALQLAEVCGLSEEVFIPLICAVPVSKKQSSADLRVSVNSLLQTGAVPADRDLAGQTQALANQMKRDAVVEEVSAARGVIHFRLNRLVLAQKLLEQLCSEPDGFGVKSELLRHHRGGRALVEFSSPNIAKKFHAGHLRSTIIGNFIANLKKALGKEVIRVNYLGDWGMQFGLLGAGFERFGSQDKLRTQPLEHLFEVYVQVNREAECDESVRSAAAEFFRRLERREDQALALWGQFREITVDEYKRIYQRLGVHFDHYSGESFHHHQTQSVLDELMTRGLLKTTQKGTAVVDLSGAGDMSSYATLVRSDGTSLYITRDVAAALDRKQRFGFDEMIYVTDKSQTVHFQQLFHILRAMGHQWAERCVHVAFGLVQGMSTRRGEVVFLEDVLEEARSRMLNNMRQSSTSKELEEPEQTAERVGISALIIQDFRGPLMSDYKFDWDKVLQAHGDTGVFLQYTHARLCSLLRRHVHETYSCSDVSPLVDSRSVSVLQHLLRYDEVLLQTVNELQPRPLVNFLLTLSHLVAVAHRELPVKGSSAAVAQVNTPVMFRIAGCYCSDVLMMKSACPQARLCLFSAVRSVLANGMRILGITPVEKM